MEAGSMNVDSPHTQHLSDLIARLIDVAERDDPSLDPALPGDLEQAADDGLILHFYVAQLLAAAGFTEAALEMVGERVAVDDSLVRESGILLRPAFSEARRDPGIMKSLQLTGQLDYWLHTDTWPDYCNEPGHNVVLRFEFAVVEDAQAGFGGTLDLTARESNLLGCPDLLGVDGEHALDVADGDAGGVGGA